MLVLSSDGKNMDSIFSGTFNWYWPAFILIFMVPVVTFMKPLLAVALSITLILTGFAGFGLFFALYFPLWAKPRA